MKKILIPVLLLILGATSSVAAESKSSDSINKIKESRKKIEDTRSRSESKSKSESESEVEIETEHSEREKKVNERCKKVEGKLRSLLEKHQTGDLRTYTKFENLIKRLDGAAQTLSAAGKDVTALNAQIVTLAGMITELQQDSQTFWEELQKSSEYTCGESQGKYVSSLQQARIAHQEHKDKIAEIKQYLRTVIRPEIERLNQ